MKFVLFCLYATAAIAQTAPPASVQDDFLRKVEELGIEAHALRHPVTPPAPLVVDVAPGDGTLQAALLAATSGLTLQLLPGQLYTGSAILPKTNPGVHVTTKGFNAGSRMVTEADAPLMARYQATQGQSYGLWIMASHFKIDGVNILYNPNICQGDMLRVGDSTSPVLTDVPDDVTVTQNLFSGNPGTACGQKRAIAANGTHLTITKNYISNIWVPGQDSQGVAVFSTPGPVLVEDNVILGSSEGVLVGGVPPAAESQLPENVTVRHNIVGRPIGWMAINGRQAKNLVEAKAGRHIYFIGNLLINHYVDAQPGYAVLATMATNGSCTYCVLEDWRFEDSLVLNVSAGVNLTGYQQYAPGSGQGVGFTIRNNLFVMHKALSAPNKAAGNARCLVMSGQPKNVVFDHNTCIGDGSALVAGDWGGIWPLRDPPLTATVLGGPVEGFVYTNNVGLHGTYGIFTPVGSSGINVVGYFPGAVIGGNVFGGATSSALTKYNAFVGSAGPNLNPAIADFNALFKDAPGGDYCPKVTGPGVDCSRLPFDLLPLAQRITQ